MNSCYEYFHLSLLCMCIFMQELAHSVIPMPSRGYVEQIYSAVVNILGRMVDLRVVKKLDWFR